MPLDTFVETLDNVDENLQTFYKPVENGEGFILDANPVKGYAVENVDNLKSALGKERTERKDYEKKFNSLSKKFEGIDLDEVKDLKDKYEKLASLDPESEAAKLSEEKIRLAEEKVNNKLTAKQKEWQKQHEQEVGSRDSKITNLTSQLKTLMVDNAATNALAEAGILPEHLELILPKVTSAVRLSEKEDGSLVQEIVDREGNPRVLSNGQDMTIADLIPELQEKWPSSFSADIKRGTGLKGSKTPVKTTQSRSEMSATDRIMAGLQKLK